MEHLRAALPGSARQTIEVRAGEKGPLVVQVAWTLVQTRSEGQVSDFMETVVVFREQQNDGARKHDYLSSNAWVTTLLAEFADVENGALHRGMSATRRRRGGLANYQVRT